jgi:hypothetical protein
MEIDDVIKNIIKIPRTFHELQNISVVDLLKQIGYFSMHKEISEDPLRKKLLYCQEYIDDWITYSEDRRTAEGFYFVQEGKEYIVGYLGKKYKFNTLRFDNKINACASYIKHEIEYIRKLCE